MTYPLNIEVFVTAYLSIVSEPDETDRKVAETMAQVINRAYYAGLADGREEAAECRE